MMDQILTKEEVASMLHVSIRSVAMFIKQGELKAYSPRGKHIYILFSDLLEYIKSSPLSRREMLSESADQEAEDNLLNEEEAISAEPKTLDDASADEAEQSHEASVRNSASVAPLGDEPNVLIREEASAPCPKKLKKTSAKADLIPPERVVSLWHECCPQLAQVTKLTDIRRKAIVRLLREWQLDKGEQEAQIRSLFHKVSASPFLTGQTGSWRASFDWIISGKGRNGVPNWLKVMEDQYKGNINSSVSGGVNYSDYEHKDYSKCWD